MESVNLDSFKNKKTALVLSGGVVKAASWHLGVILALEELGFSFKGNRSIEDDIGIKKSLEVSTYVGSSAGALISIFLACGYSAQEIIDGVLGLNSSSLKRITYRNMFHLNTNKIKPLKRELYHPLEDLPGVLRGMLKPLLNFAGPFSTQGIKKYLLKNVLDKDDFESFNSDLFIVGTQLDDSRKVIFSKYNYPNPSHDSTASYQTGVKVSDAAAASMSVPPFYAPYPIVNNISKETEYYIDGEIRETLSTHVAEDNNCDLIISSWTHTPYHFHDEVGSLINYGLPNIVIQSIYLLIQKKIVAARAQRATAADIIDTVSQYMKDERLSSKHQRNIVSIIERKLNFNKNVQYIDIFPDHHDYKLFFANSFSLKHENAAYAVRSGYKRTMETLSNLGL